MIIKAILRKEEKKLKRSNYEEVSESTFVMEEKKEMTSIKDVKKQNTNIEKNVL